RGRQALQNPFQKVRKVARNLLENPGRGALSREPEAAIQRLGASRSRSIAGLLRLSCTVNFLPGTPSIDETAGGSDHLAKFETDRLGLPGNSRSTPQALLRRRENWSHVF